MDQDAEQTDHGERVTARTRFAWILGALAATGSIGVWFFGGPSDIDLAGDRDFDAEAVSEDLDADLRRMWETEPLPSGDGEASTIRAIMAASRVFNTVSLVGKTGADVKALLGSPVHSNRSVYRGSPFWPLRSRGMIYRFDCGRFGWQFNVYCEGDDAPVSEVERQWIH